MDISRKTRPARAGVQIAEAIIEMVHLMYLNPHALEFLNTFTETMNREFERRRTQLYRKGRWGTK